MAILVRGSHLYMQISFLIYLLSDTYRMEASNREESMKFGMMVYFYMLFKVRRGSHSRNALVGVKWRKCGVKM